MRHAIFAPALALLLLAASFDRADRSHRPLSPRTLSTIRGADPGSATKSITYCDTQNSGSGQVDRNGCSSATATTSTVCVWCFGDNATSRQTEQGATGPNFEPVDYYACGGKKISGVCTPSSPGSAMLTCVSMAWDGSSYCGGYIYESIKQAPMSGP